MIFKKRYEKLVEQNQRLLNEIDVLKKLILEIQKHLGMDNGLRTKI